MIILQLINIKNQDNFRGLFLKNSSYFHMTQSNFKVLFRYSATHYDSAI